MTTQKKNMAKATLHPDHDRWAEFVNEMLWSCDYTNCDHNTNRITRDVLRKMKGIKVAKTLMFFRSLGGYCDCEVMLNVIAGGEPAVEGRIIYMWLAGMPDDFREAFCGAATNEHFYEVKAALDKRRVGTEISVDNSMIREAKAAWAQVKAFIVDGASMIDRG